MAEKTLALRIVTPERQVYAGDVKSVLFESIDGQLGVLPGHIPLSTVIKTSVFQMEEEEGTKELAVHQGFVEIQGDRVSVLTETAEWPEEIDMERAQRAYERAKGHLDNPKKGITDVQRAEIALNKALTRMKVVKKGKE
ncbi:MAG: ATP synthase F1 subunit epsilon [Firmicutes bacterium]|nr:ATP synthase F1 subunit epsilon [Bacillota bacterium]